MADAVSRFCQKPTQLHLLEAKAKVASLRASENEEVGRELDALYNELGKNYSTSPEEKRLTVIIEKKRETQRYRQAEKTKPKITERLHRGIGLLKEKQLQKHFGDHPQTKQK